MSFSKKKPESELSPDEQIIAATERMQKLQAKKTITGYRYSAGGKQTPIYADNHRNKRIDDEIELAKLQIELAEQNKQNPQSGPRQVIYDRSKKTIITANLNTEIGCGNKSGLIDSFNGNGSSNSFGKKKTSSKSAKNSDKQPQTKRINKVKLTFILIGLVFLVALTAFVSVKIANCANSKNTAQANACAIFSMTSE